MKRAAVLLTVLLVAAIGAAVARGLQFMGSAKPGPGRTPAGPYIVLPSHI